MTKQQLVFKLLAQADWNEIAPKLLAYTVRLAQNRRWRGISGSVDKGTELIYGVSCADIVQTVITKALRGERKWDPDKGELELWLRQQIESEVSHLVESSVHQHERSEISEDLDRQLPTLTVASASAHLATSAEAVALRRIDFAEQVAAIYDATADDPEVEEVVAAILDGCEPKPQALAEELSTDVRDINNRLKRMRRRIDEVHRT